MAALLGDKAESIPLGLEDPRFVVEGFVDEDEDYFSVRDYSPNTMPTTSDLSDPSLHPYVALSPAQKPAEIVLESLKGVPNRNAS